MPINNLPTASPPMTAPGMQQADPLAQLRDIHLPEPISWWPPAPGLWLVAILLLTIIFFATRWLIKRRRNNSYRREALQQLEHISSAYDDKLEQCHELMALLRRTAKTAYPKQTLESELNPVFFSRLNQYCKQPVFDEQLVKQLGELPYQANPTISSSMLQQLSEAANQWLKKHRLGTPC